MGRSERPKTETINDPPESGWPAVRTVIVSWHWPPTNRASAGVLGALFSDSPSGAFRVVTRSFPHHAVADQRGSAQDLDLRVQPTYVPWPVEEKTPLDWRYWPTIVRTVSAMIRSTCRLAKDWNAERILAIYPHRLSLLAGWLAAKRSGLPLVLYMHDLCAEGSVIQNPVRRAWWNWVDRVALRRAALVIVPTEEFAAHYRRRNVENVFVLPHCLPRKTSETTRTSPNGRLRIVYSGAVYEPHAGAARAVIDATSDDAQRDEYEINWLTDPKAMNGRLATVGARWLPHEQAAGEVRRSHVGLVLLDRESPCPHEVKGCFPSKIVEYVAAGLPILAIVPEGCFVDRLIANNGCGVVARQDDPEGIRRAIAELRDERARRAMSVAAGNLADRLRAEDWMPRLLGRLSERARSSEQVRARGAEDSSFNVATALALHRRSMTSSDSTVT